MRRIWPLFIVMNILFLLPGCNKKSHPAKASNAASVTPKKIKTPLPKVITVTEGSAHKTFDGRYYYDLMGHRYWRNNKDGKYYLYSKSMNTDPAFKP